MGALLYLYYSFAFAYVILLPSFVLGKALFPGERLAVRLGMGLAISVTLVPLFGFGIAMLFGTYISDALLFIVASLITIVTLWVQISSYRRRARRMED